MPFSPDWLNLREPVDHASRDAGLLARAIDVAGPDAVVVDLGCGTGSTARAFGVQQCHWRFVDGDARLLDLAKAHHVGSEVYQADLGDIEALPLSGATLVTASALLDLMPRTWVEKLAQRLAAENLPFYAALNYNGQMSWKPEHPQDAAITAAFNAHQRSDKGLGGALGPMAAEVTAEIFAAAGFEVMTGDSPWHLGAQETALHQQLLDGIAAAADENGYDGAVDWAHDRKASKATGYIGHTDVLSIQRKAGD